jgi:uncharacterized protein (UPF0332 family)
MIILLIKRAENELVIAEKLNEMSSEQKIKDYLEIPKDMTFYSGVISHAYYSIFYSAKAYLLNNKIKVQKQGQHQKVFFEFKRLVKKGLVDKELLRIYEETKIKAEVLFDIFKSERDKRSNFTYETLPQANKEPARESMENALFFVSHIKKFLRNDF